MSFNTSWDVDQYKTEYESEEHWELRRNFMLKHKDRYPEERLVCLAQVFINVEFLGCRYPQETMELVAQLSDGVVEDYREKQKSKLQRTFVKASDAAEAKFKGLKRPTGVGEHGPSKIAKYMCGPSFMPEESKINGTLPSDDSSLKNVAINGDNLIKQKFTNNLSSKLESDCENGPGKDFSYCASTSSPSSKIETISDTLIVPEVEEKDVKPRITIDDVRHKKFGLLVIVEAENDHPFSTLMRSTSTCKIKYEERMEEAFEKVYCKIFINGHLLTTKSSRTKGVAKKLAAIDAYEKLKQICYTLKIKKANIGKHAEPNIDGTLLVESEVNVDGHNPNALSTPLEENIGAKLMRSMGWAGGGLGKNQQGIEEPVRLSNQIHRTGLGHESPAQGRGSSETFRRNARNLLSNYVNKQSIADLVFSTDYTKEERAYLHKLCTKYKLKSKSYGNKNCRKLVISRKNIDILKIVKCLLESKTYSNEEYELIKPSITLSSESKSNLLESKSLSVEVTPVSTTPKLQSNQESSKCSPAIGSTTFSEKVKNSKTNSCSSSEKYSVKDTHSLLTQETKHPIDAGQFGRFILIENGLNLGPAQVIERSANSCHVHFGYQYENNHGEITCKLFVNNALVSSCTGTSKKAARERTLMKSLAKLREICYTLRIEEKQEYATIKTMKTLILPTAVVCKNDSKAETQIPCESKQVTKAAAGIKGDEIRFVFKNKVRNVLKEYISDLLPYDLVISSDFSSSEQQCIQQLASSVALKSTLRGEPNKQVLVVSKKLTPLDTAEALLYHKELNCEMK